MSVSLPGTKHPWSFKVPFVMVVRTALALDRVYAIYTLWALVAFVLGFGFHLLSHVQDKILAIVLDVVFLPFLLGTWSFIWFMVVFLTNDHPEKIRKVSYFVFVSLMTASFPLYISIIYIRLSKHHVFRLHYSLKDMMVMSGAILLWGLPSQLYTFSYAIGRYLMNLRDYRTRGYPEPVEMRKAIRAVARRLAAGKG